MSERTHHERSEHDDDCNVIYTKRQWVGPHPVDFNVSSDINKSLLKRETWNIKKEMNKKPNIQLASVNVDLLDTINVIDTFDRPADASTKGRYAQCGKYALGFEDKPGHRIPKAGVYAEAGVGRVAAEVSVLEAEAKGPNASAGVGASVTGAGMMARAEVGSVSAKAGPVAAKLGLGVDTGVSIGAGGLEAKFLGTGITFGPKTSVSLLGSEVSCSVM
ncbi:uncharacterized protein LOC122331731 [Puntigrus tetrazona]|uniref:uncharacterized protein LOC122331731 n=1 Tax=Puntigrus tetrazona TaxID=1606681 RepID=UPI001C89EE8B|nr:uncharacterized protein LOC122331731 [Puntigrus tetrazona]